MADDCLYYGKYADIPVVFFDKTVFFSATALYSYCFN